VKKNGVRIYAGVFDDDRYFDVFVEYAKESPEDKTIARCKIIYSVVIYLLMRGFHFRKKAFMK